MKGGVFISFLIHALIIVGGIRLFGMTLPNADAIEMAVLDVDLVTIDETTNVAPVTAKAELDEEATEVPEDEVSTPNSAAPAPEEVVIPEAETPPPPKKDAEAEKKDVKPAPKPKEEDFQSALQQLMAEANKAPKQSRSASAEKATNLKDVPDAAPRKGYGDMKRMTATVKDFITSQLTSNNCWTDQEDMADARRLRATIRVRFGRDGHFLGAPQLIEPSREPSGDPPLQVFVQRARIALEMCNKIGFRVPAEYFEVQPAQYIDIVFLP
ncbi:MAG: hypothetical protein Q8R02_15675 [Hyphomonadaceae bacterium]|nr:hypothetical protein [Hyphomonadaceae bacterium]